MRITDRTGHSRWAQVVSIAIVTAMVLTGYIPAAIAPRTLYASDITPPPAPPLPPPAIVGFIDTHLHQFANLGFGGLEVWGSPVDPTLDASAPIELARARALPDSDFMYVSNDLIGTIRGGGGVPVVATPGALLGNFPQCPDPSEMCWRVTIHGVNGTQDLINAFAGDGAHGTNGYRSNGVATPGMQWPTSGAVTTQQAYWEWLKRAHEHGLKMITMHAVNNAVLCTLAVGIFPFGCDDDSSVIRQIQGAKNLEAYIDARSGGPGQGFYRIVYNSAQARQVIQQGKLAVVLGVEVDTPRGCVTSVNCDAIVAGMVQQYYDRGIRVVYPVHLIDNAFGGAALYDPLFELNNFVINHSFWNVTTTCAPGDPQELRWRSGIRDLLTPELKVAIALASPVIVAAVTLAISLGGIGLAPALTGLIALLGASSAVPELTLIATVAQSSMALAGTLLDLLVHMFVDMGPVGAVPDPNCNLRGLTLAGTALVNGLMNHGMMIDVDHSDRRVFDAILDIAETRHYPGIVAGHTGLLGAARSDEVPDATGLHEGTKTDAMVERIVGVGGFLSVIPHQGGRSRIRDVSASDSVAFDCGNSSQSWAQVYLYATKDLGLTSVGIGSDMNGFAGWPAPRYGPGACGGDHAVDYSPSPQGGVNYGPSLVDYYGNALPQYQFGNRTWDYNTEGLAHVGLYPDFIADLQAIGLGNDLGPLFNSVEGYVRMWEKVDDHEAPIVHCGTVGDDWHADDVAVPCNAYDTGYGLANAADANFSLTTAVADGVETPDATTGAYVSICDAGGHCTPAISAITGINVDKKAPTVAVTTPADANPVFLLAQVVLADYGCSDGGSGLATCAGPVANGDPLDTTIGSHAFVVNSTDNVENAASVSHPYTVAFDVCLQYDPTKAVKAGATVPIKVRLCDAVGANVSSASIVLTATGVTQLSTSASGVLEDAGNANPDNEFRYVSSVGGYIFNLKTTGFGVGTYALSFTASGDPTTHQVQFQVR